MSSLAPRALDQAARWRARTAAGAAVRWWALVAVLSATFSVPLAAAEEKTPDLPTARRALRNALRTLRREKNYALTLRYERGIAEDATHRAKSSVSRATYTGNVLRNRFMHVPKYKAYRTPTRGVWWEPDRIKQGGTFRERKKQKVNGGWRAIVFPAQSVGGNKAFIMHSRFYFPTEILEDAMTHVGSARWVDQSLIPEATPQDDDGDAADADTDPDLDRRDKKKKKKKKKKKNSTAEKKQLDGESQRSKGRTRVDRPKHSTSAVKPEKLIRVTVPPKLAQKKRVSCGGWG